MNMAAPLDLATAEKVGPVFTIAGGGFSGTAIITQLIEKLKTDWHEQADPDSFPLHTIVIADPAKDIGPGGPYDHEDDTLLLNQPAYAMSPFERQSGHFVNWLQERHPDVSRWTLENSFQPRRTYGEYLKEVFSNAVENIGNAPIQVTVVKQSVSDATHTGLGFAVQSVEGETWKSDSLIVANGHFKNGYLADLRDKEFYFEDSVSSAEIESIPDNHGAVLIVGSSQTMIDRLSQLDKAGYQGDIHIVSRRGVMPWEFKPELYHPARNAPAYELQVFTPENTQGKSFEALVSLWDEEISIAKGQSDNIQLAEEYGPGHVLKAFYDREAEFESFTASREGQAMLAHIQAVYGNPTSPQKHEMLQKYLNNGQIKIHNSNVQADKFNEKGDEITLDNGTTLQVDAVFNAGACARILRRDETSPIRSPLIARLDQRSYMLWSSVNGILEKGRQKISDLFYGGPYAYNQKWGCETFRKGHEAIARDSIGAARQNFEHRKERKLVPA